MAQLISVREPFMETFAGLLLISLHYERAVQVIISVTTNTAKLKVETVRLSRDAQRHSENAAKSRNYADESMDASSA